MYLTKGRMKWNNENEKKFKELPFFQINKLVLQAD